MCTLISPLSPIFILAVSTLSMASAILAFSSRETSDVSRPFKRSRPRDVVRMDASADPFCAEAFAVDADGRPCPAGRGRPWRIHTSNLSGTKVSGYDVSSARGWMEHIEERDGPVVGVGAYTVLRCDARYDGRGECQWKIWGLEYHLDRLCESYEMLLQSLDRVDGEESRVHDELDRGWGEARLQTENDVLTALLDEAETSLLLPDDATRDHDDGFVRTLMVTILWTPSNPNIVAGGHNTGPIVRGHAAFAAAASVPNDEEEPMSPPIVACLGVPTDPTPAALAMLPRRYCGGEDPNRAGPRAKVSSWCRARRPLEDPGRYKPPGNGVGEVLLVRQNEALVDSDGSCVNSLEILEGLTSNLFVVYHDGTVRTAPADKVLSGYARHLVVEQLNDMRSNESFPSSLPKLTLDESRAPAVKDARDGLWKEVFVTSSIRLVVPVNRVEIPPVGGMDSMTLWQAEHDENGAHFITRSIRAAIRERGYEVAMPR